MTSLLRVQNLEKNFKNFSLQVETFAIKQGEKVAFVGENGSGKTTFMKVLADLIKPSRGNIIRNYDLAEQGFLLANSRWNIPYTIKTLLKFWEGKHKEAIINLLEIHKILKTSYQKLSEGQRQRFHLALVLSQEARIFFLDEPTTSLDARYSEILREWITKSPATFVIATHNEEFVKKLNLKIYQFKNGKIL